MDTLQATVERWINLTGSDGKVKGRLNLTTGELVIRERGVYHKWALNMLLSPTPACDNACVSYQENTTIG